MSRIVVTERPPSRASIEAKQALGKRFKTMLGWVLYRARPYERRKTTPVNLATAIHLHYHGEGPARRGKGGAPFDPRDIRWRET
jgi:hypothetical protein